MKGQPFPGSTLIWRNKNEISKLIVGIWKKKQENKCKQRIHQDAVRFTKCSVR